VDRPVKGLWLQAEGLAFDDNFIDLVPGTPRQVAVQGDRPTVLQWQALDHPLRAIALAH